METANLSFQATNRLFDLIETKLHLLSEMQALSIEQSDLVSQHEVGDLLSLLSRKQSLMESLQGLQDRLREFQYEDPESRVWERSEKRQRCQQMVSQCDELISRLIVQENRSLENMNLKRDSVLTQLQQTIAASELQQAYGSTDHSADEATSQFNLEG